MRQLVLFNTTLRKDFRPPLYWRPFTTDRIGHLLLVRLKLFSWGLPFLLRAARSRLVREQYSRFLQVEDTCKTIFALERLESFDTLMEQVELAVQDIRAPILILWGHPDPYYQRSELEQLQRLFPHATVREIARGGHFPHEDTPEIVTRELLAFLR